MDHHNDTESSAPRFLISGGGTGGHIFPALSIADALRRRYPHCRILFVGAEDRMEMKRVPDAGYEIVGLPVAGFDRRHIFRNISVLFKLWRSMCMARRIVADFRPDVAIGVGGYASGPTLKAAQAAGVPTAIPEQNAYAGVTNKLLARRARRICVAYPGMERFFPADTILLTGNPVRKAILEPGMSQAEAKTALGFRADRPLVLVVGGSLGARTLNDAIIAAVESGAANQAPFQILWQCGGRDARRCGAEVAEKLPRQVVLVDFISDMATAYAAADLVVARAGAGTISELELLGKPAVLVPSPNVAEDHQRHNAQALAERGAAAMILDADAATELWPTMSRIVKNPETLALLSQNITAMACHDSDERIVDAISDLIRK